MASEKQVQLEADELSLFSDEESVGSIFSFSDEEQEDITLTVIMKERAIEFQKRDELLLQLMKGIDPKHAIMMKKMEQAIRHQKVQCDIRRVTSTRVDADSPTRTSVSSRSSSEEPLESNGFINGRIGWVERAKQVFPLSVRFRVQGFVILALNCVAYNAGKLKQERAIIPRPPWFSHYYPFAL
jgi:hypothetical protein